MFSSDLFITSERPFSDEGMYNNRFPNVSVGF